MSSLEWRAYSLGAHLSPAPVTNDRLTVVTIDEASLKELGEWPWPRSYIARVIKKLDAAGAQTIGLALPLHTPQSAFGVTRLKEMSQSYKGKKSKFAKNLLTRARQSIDTDGALKNSLRQSAKVVLPITRGQSSGAQLALPSTGQNTLKLFSFTKPTLENTPWFSYIPGVLTLGIPAMEQPLPPISKLAKYSSAGYFGDHGLGDRHNQAIPLILSYNNNYYPSFSLMFTIKSLGLKLANIEFDSRHNIKLGNRNISIDPGFRVYPRYYKNNNDKPAFKTYSFHEIYKHRIRGRIFRNKDVLIGITAPSLVVPLATASGENMAPVMASAHVINNLLHNDNFKVPSWAIWVQLAAFALIACYLMFVLPKFRFITGIITSVMLLFILINAHVLVLMAISTIWVPLMTPIAALFVGSIVIAAKQKLDEKHQKIEDDLFESNRTLGQNLQSQGRLDQAFEKYQKCRVNEALLNQLYNLGLDYERRRQFAKAEMVFQYIKNNKANYRDVKNRTEKNQEMQTMVVLPKGGTSEQGTLILTNIGVQKPMLGRYQVEKEIGRGAMGLVYLGKDPKIGRTVAIKTMAFSHEFSEDALEEVKKRFFREAEAAGRLNHPNIVTIYDVGEEQELAYIAMDYLKGKDLSAYRTAKTLLTLDKVLNIAIDVAEALDYAHKQNVVHRDIKPHNIIYDLETGITKVTDFGVACLIDASSTKTGTMLGSPSYMSPEQACGKKVDGRSDLFSLGVTLFQLTTGKLPFVSESLAALTYMIANDRHPDIRKLAPDVPACLYTIVNKSLHKDVDKRYQDGKQMAAALRQCLNKLE